MARCSVTPRTTILLATRNGERFLAAQLRSIREQIGSTLDLICSDDGSTDGTPAILREFAEAVYHEIAVELVEGPGQGFCANFRRLVFGCRDPGDQVAFCDQDDIWDRTKLASAWETLSTMPHDVPAVWCGRTRIITEVDQKIGWSPLFKRPPTFRNALVQSIAGGNTMVMNRAAFGLVQRSLEVGVPVSHDWWVYKIVTGAGGRVVYVPDSGVSYRMHPGNLIGPNQSWRARWVRLKMIAQGRFRDWNATNLKLLSRCRHLMVDESLEVLDRFKRAHDAAGPRGLPDLAASGVHRQRMSSTILMYGACAAGKF